MTNSNELEILHKPVLLKDVLNYLNLRPGKIIIDGTIGSGGHAEAILERVTPSGKLIGIDLDEEALKRAKKRLSRFGDALLLIKGNFADMDILVAQLNVKSVDGILLDLGVSMEQLARAERGFSFRVEGPLDMRYDTSFPLDARHIVNRYSLPELVSILREFGEERAALKIAKAIKEARDRKPVERTTELALLVEKATRFGRGKKSRIHPATKVFQALRIAVNNELENLEKALQAGMKILAPGGRFCVISFHSLEDRIVKRWFNAWQRGFDSPLTTAKAVDKAEALAEVLTKKPVRPSPEEVKENPASRSAKMRVAKKI